MDDGYEKDDGRVTMHVRMRVTPAQALALRSMFSYWNVLASMGGSREVGFYVDGDGNFKPNCQTSLINPHEVEIPELTDELKQLAVVRDNHGDKLFDFDPIAWKINE